MKNRLKKFMLNLPGIRSIVWRFQKQDRRLTGQDKRITQLEQKYIKLFLHMDKVHKESERQMKDEIEKIWEQLGSLRQENERLQRWKEEYQNNSANQIQGIRDWCVRLEKDDKYYYYKGLVPERYEKELGKWFKERTGEELELEHPKTYNQIIQWTKLKDIDALKIRLANKYLVRDWVAERIGEKYLIPLLGVWENFDDIDFDQLPDKFALKANHGCGYNVIVKDKETFNRLEARRKFNKWLDTDFAFVYGFEIQYSYILPRIIAEEYLENQNEELNDYKVFCFNGKAKYIMFLTNRSEKLKMAFYDTEWNLQPFTYTFERYETSVEPPENLQELIEISESLAKDFVQVRVDFYRTNAGEWKFGEMTFTTSSGTCKWNPPEYNEILGGMIHIDEKKLAD